MLVEKIEELLIFLPDSPAVYGEWKRLVSENEVFRTKVHDARLVATMKAHRVIQLLTFDTADFRRYSEDEVLDPKFLSTQGLETRERVLESLCPLLTGTGDTG